MKPWIIDELRREERRRIERSRPQPRLPAPHPLLPREEPTSRQERERGSAEINYEV